MRTFFRHNKEKKLNNRFGSLLRRTAEHGKPEYTWAPRRLAGQIGISAAIYIWLTSVTLYTTSFTAALGASATNPHVPMGGMDFVVIGVTAFMFILTSSVWDKVPETLRHFWMSFEDFWGRPVVIVHALLHALISERFSYIRKFVGWSAVFGAVTLLLWGCRLTARLAPTLPHEINAGVALSHFMTPRMFLFTLSMLVSATLGALVLRLGFAQKWRAIFAKPKCDERPIAERLNQGTSTPVKLLHASDLHVTASEHAGLIETGQRISDAVLSEVFAAIEDDAAICDAVLLTGDITDDGAAASWERFLKLCPPGLRNKVILLPGNHDLNLQQGGVTCGGFFRRIYGWLSLAVNLKAERFDNFGRRMRQIRALCVMTELMGERAYLVDRRTNRLTTLQEYFSSHQAAIDAHISGSEGPRTPMSQLWNDMFPLVVGAGDHRVGVVLLDSVKPASINVTNAIGAMQPKAIASCEALMAATADKFDCFAIALHHHIAIPSGSTWAARFKSAFLVFENATELVEMLTKRGEPSVVLHGHRHQEYVGAVENSEVSVVATASATVGAHGRAGHGSWRVVELATAKDGCRLSTEPRHRTIEQHRSNGEETAYAAEHSGASQSSPLKVTAAHS